VIREEGKVMNLLVVYIYRVRAPVKSTC